MDDSQKNHNRTLPAHYPTLRDMLIGVLSAYGRSINSTLRLLGTCIVSGTLFMALWVCMTGISTLFFRQFESAAVIHTIMVLFAPPIIRAGVIATAVQSDMRN